MYCSYNNEEIIHGRRRDFLCNNAIKEATSIMLLPATKGCVALRSYYYYYHMRFK